MSKIYHLAPLPFGSLSYWAFIFQNKVHLNPTLRFEKSSLMNRVILNNQGTPLTISIPIEGGRNSKHPLDQASIASDGWRNDLIRSIETLYQNAPYFDYFGDDVIGFIQNIEHTTLGAFNLASLDKLKDWVPPLKHIFEQQILSSTNEESLETYTIKALGKQTIEVPLYHHIPNQWHASELNHLSILDLLFLDAPHLYNIIDNIKFLQEK